MFNMPYVNCFKFRHFKQLNVVFKAFYNKDKY